jgi:hypothetical protein
MCRKTPPVFASLGHLSSLLGKRVGKSRHFAQFLIITLAPTGEYLEGLPLFAPQRGLTSIRHLPI